MKVYTYNLISLLFSVNIMETTYNFILPTLAEITPEFIHRCYYYHNNKPLAVDSFILAPMPFLFFFIHFT